MPISSDTIERAKDLLAASLDAYYPKISNSYDNVPDEDKKKIKISLSVTIEENPDLSEHVETTISFIESKVQDKFMDDVNPVQASFSFAGSDKVNPSTGEVMQ